MLNSNCSGCGDENVSPVMKGRKMSQKPIYFPSYTDFLRVQHGTPVHIGILLFLMFDLALDPSELSRVEWRDVDILEMKVKIGSWYDWRSSVCGDVMQMSGIASRYFVFRWGNFVKKHKLARNNLGDTVHFDNYVFNHVNFSYSIMRSVCTELDVKPFSLRSIRPLSAFHLLQSGLSLETIQWRLRFRTMEHTINYVSRLKCRS